MSYTIHLNSRVNSEKVNDINSIINKRKLGETKNKKENETCASIIGSKVEDSKTQIIPYVKNHKIHKSLTISNSLNILQKWQTSNNKILLGNHPPL